VERPDRLYSTSASLNKKKYAKAIPTELITSQLVLNISNWGFVRDLTQSKKKSFVPCSVHDVHVAIKLSSSAFKSSRIIPEEG